MGSFTLRELERLIQGHIASGATDSRMAKILEKGTEHAAKKLIEEAAELALAKDQDDAIAESADLLFRLMLLLNLRGIAISAIEIELFRRTLEPSGSKKAIP